MSNCEKKREIVQERERKQKDRNGAGSKDTQVHMCKEDKNRLRQRVKYSAARTVDGS